MKIRFEGEVQAPPNLSIRDAVKFLSDVSMDNIQIVSMELVEDGRSE